MRRLLTMIAAACFITAPVIAQPTTTAPQVAPAGAYAADKPHTSITWQGLHNNLAWYTARFTSFDIQLDFNPTDVTKSKVTATIDPKSVETDYGRTKPSTSTQDFNNEVATGDRFLNANKFAEIKFVSTAITKTGENTGKMTGNLTFLGVTKPVTLDVTYIGNRSDPRSGKHRVGFQLKGKFNRSDWGMAKAPPVGDEIRIEINSELILK